jgi:superfamily II DNA or RNA helicase
MPTKHCKIVIHDQCNASFLGLDATTRRACNKALKFFIHAARHTPAYRLGRWDGCISFFAVNGNTYVNVLEKIWQIIVDAGYTFELEDHRPQPEFEFGYISNDYFSEHFPGLVWPKHHPAAGQPITLRDYQVEVITSAVSNLQSVQEISTGSGKTIICAALSHMCEDYGRTIIIVPNKDLVKQTLSDYQNIGLDVGVYFGEKKEHKHKHIICTWQSLDRLAKAAAEGTGALTMEQFLQGVVCVIVDEVHSAKATVLRDILTGPLANIPIRWGLTGTIPPEEFNAMSILCSIGPVVKQLAAKTLMDLGVLAKCHVNLIQMLDTVDYDEFHAEYDYLVTDKNRLDWIGNLIGLTAQTGNTLVLVNRIETGKELQKRISTSVFVSGATKTDVRKDAYLDMSDNDNKIIIATYGVASVGINIPRIFNLIIVEPGKSFIRVIQSIGRSIRIARDKNSVEIYDIASTCKFSAKHLNARKKFYRKAEYPYTLQKVNYIEQLAQGISQ